MFIFHISELTSKNLQNSSLFERDLLSPSLISHHFVVHLIRQSLPKITIIVQSLKIETCKKQAPTTKFASIFNLNMLSTILDVNHYKKSQNGCHSSIVQDRHLGCQLSPMTNNMNANLINDGHQPRIFKFSKFSNV